MLFFLGNSTMRTCAWCGKQYAREGNYDHHRLLCSFRHTKKASFDDLVSIVAQLVERVEAQEAELVVLRRAAKKTLSAEEWLNENHPAAAYQGLLLQNLERLLEMDKPFEQCLEFDDEAGFAVVRNQPYCYDGEWMKMQASQTEALMGNLSKQITGWFNDYVEENELVGHDKYPEYTKRIFGNLSKVKKIVMERFKIRME